MKKKTIPTYYRMNTLPQHIKARACDVFNVTPEVFDTGQKLENMGELLRKIENCERKQAIHDDRFDAMDAQIQALRDNDAAQRREIDALRRENTMLRHTSNVN